MNACRILLVANQGSGHVGQHLMRAAESASVIADCADIAEAWEGHHWVRRLLWSWDRRPVGLRQFGRELVQRCDWSPPAAILVIGLSPPHSEVVAGLAKRGIKLACFLTDDPFNPMHKSDWFTSALRHYPTVFTPRRVTLPELHSVCSGHVSYLQFAYSPHDHFVTREEPPRSACDVLFVGGADRDRIPFAEALLKAGLGVELYGGYWDRTQATRGAHRGIGDPETIRRATAAAKVNLILVRRANRDGHVMRSFEAAACGGCLLVEETDEHREIFGDTVTYFGTADEMVRQTRGLLADPERRRASAEASHRRIVIEGKNTYADRLRTILQTLGVN